MWIYNKIKKKKKAFHQIHTKYMKTKYKAIAKVK